MFFGMDLLQHRLLPIWLDRDVQRCLQLHWYPIDDERVRQLADLREQMLKLSLDILHMVCCPAGSTETSKCVCTCTSTQQTMSGSSSS